MALHNSVQFTLITPSALVLDTEIQVEVHLEFNEPINEGSLKIFAEEGNRKWDLKEIDHLNNVIMVDIAPEQMGALKIGIESESGVRMSPYATIIVAPAVVVEDLTRILEQTSEDLVNSVRNGTAHDTSITVAQLEENPLLSKRVAWRDHIHPMIVDFGSILEHMKLREGHIIGEDVNPACHLFVSKMVHMLRFLLKNDAHKAGTFLLQYAASVGELITLDGVPLTADNLDLELLQQTA